MLSGAIFTIATGVIWTLVAIIYSSIAGKQKSIAGFMFLYTVIFTTLIWIFRTPQAAPAKEICQVAWCMLPSALLGQLGFFILFLAMKKGSHAVAWTFTQSAMVIPFLGSWLFFDNLVKWFNFAGLLLIIVALIGLGISKNKPNAIENKSSHLALILSLIALLVSGISQFCSLIPGEMGISTEALSWRLPINTIVGVSVWGIAALIKLAKMDWQTVKYSSIYGLVVAVGQVTLYMAIDALTPLNMMAII
jgi:uncharacterized membrane protein